MPEQNIDYRHFGEVVQAARKHLITIVSGKRTLADIVWSITDIGVRFGIDEAHRPEKDRTTPGKLVNLPGSVDNFRDLVAHNEDKALELLFTPSGNQSPLDRVAVDLIRNAVSYSLHKEALKDREAEKLLNSIVQTAKVGAKGELVPEAAKVEALMQRLLAMGDEKMSGNVERAISYLRRLLTEHNVAVNGTQIPSFRPVVDRYARLMTI